MTKNHNFEYKATEAERRTRLAALKVAKWHFDNDYEREYPESRLVAAEELLGYNQFTSQQISEWLDIGAYRIDQEDATPPKAWGIGGLRAENLGLAIELAEAGVRGERPKALIHEARTEGMTFNQIGGLVGIHKQEALRIYSRLEGLTLRVDYT